MARQTLLGTAHWVEESGRHPAELRNMVTSPGGTTAEGLFALEQAGLRAALTDAVIAAHERSKALG
jgi:pyrroline-5-carboxylate reductase